MTPSIITIAGSFVGVVVTVFVAVNVEGGNVTVAPEVVVAVKAGSPCGLKQATRLVIDAIMRGK
jgi:hypothetical protein